MRDELSNRSDKNNTAIETKQAPDYSGAFHFFFESAA
jgi:hypothetical protein